MALAGGGVAGWLMVDEPVIATVCVIVADFVAALMMLPKTWRQPGSETLATYVFASLGGAATVGAVGLVSVSLLIYPVYFMLINAGLATVICYRGGFLRRDAAAAAVIDSERSLVGEAIDASPALVPSGATRVYW